MRVTRALLDYFLFTSSFIAALAAIMTLHALRLSAQPVSAGLIVFVVCGTLCSYNFHWMLTPALFSGGYKAGWSVRHRRLHLLLFLLSAAGAAYAGWQLRSPLHWLLLTAFMTFLYSAPKIPLPVFRSLKKAAVGKTAFLALAWTHVPYMLPLLLRGGEWSLAEYLLVFNRFFLIYPICILFDYRDRKADRAEGIRSLATELPEQGVRRLFQGCLLVFFISNAALPFAGIPLSESAFLLLPGLLLALAGRQAQRQRSDYFYYGILDGLMGLSAALSLLCSFT